MSKNSLGNIVYYTGFTNNPKRRLEEHKSGIKSNFMRLNKIMARAIVYLETFDSVEEALKREQQIKRLPRLDKIKLIQEYANRFKE